MSDDIFFSESAKKAMAYTILFFTGIRHNDLQTSNFDTKKSYIFQIAQNYLGISMQHFLDSHEFVTNIYLDRPYKIIESTFSEEQKNIFSGILQDIFDKTEYISSEEQTDKYILLKYLCDEMDLPLYIVLESKRMSDLI